MKALPKKYDPTEAEKRWQEHWFASGTYHFADDLPKEQTFVVDTPPPTVSGLLHMGHIFSYTQADFVARYQRMSGRDVFYPMGFDDNGLPTERLVEKVKKIKAHKYISDHGREAFVALCREVVVEAEEEFRRLFKSAALSVDWRQEYQTISDEVRALSQASFIELFNKNEAYRKLQPMLWDPVDQTAIAQAEIEDKELKSSFNDILFGVVGSDEKVTIGTTRPELLGACVAVFYHPEDARYTHLAGKQAVTPLFGAKVPFLADEHVQQDKGTGLVMCCTFGDETDIMWWREHELDTRVILNKYGKLTFSDEVKQHYESSSAPLLDELEGKKTSNPDKNHPGAREIILDKLKDAGLLTKQESITHAVKCAERSGAPLEILPTHQWFVRVLEHKDALLKKARECDWNPDYMRLRLEQWIEGLSWDWCISRQRFFGVPFPVWYSQRAGEEGKIIVPDRSQLPVDPLVDVPEGYSKDEVIGDPDVMDTWATSSITPQISAKGEGLGFRDWDLADSSINPKSQIPNPKLFPASIRPQAHEIIRSWAFYTLLKSHLHADSIPWKHLMISGWCLAADKTKMSKSKGNVVTPVELIEEKGTDAVRYWASTSRLGADTAFSEDALKIGRKLVTKLWNASNFIAGVLEQTTPDKPDTLLPLDKWILTRLHRTVAKATEQFENFEYCAARMAIEDFFWNDFCDNYLELVKARAYGEDVAGKASAHYALTTCLEAVLRLFAPFVPHVTEELYSHLFDANHASYGSIHARGTWPVAQDYPLDEPAEQAGFAAVEILNAIRKAKSEAGVSIKYPVESVSITAKTDAPGMDAFEQAKDDIAAAGNVSQFGSADAEAKDTEDGNYTVAVQLAEQAEAKVANEK